MITNTLLQTGASNLSTNLAVKSRAADSKAMRCTDYDTNKDGIMCLNIIKTAQLNSSSTCYKIFYGKNNASPIKSIAEI